MTEYSIKIPTMTYALKARDLLRKKGIEAKIEKTFSKSGCTFNLWVNEAKEQIIPYLLENGIKILI